MILVQALEWWYDSAEGKLAAQRVLPVPPPPPAPPPHADGLPLPPDPTDCAVCRRQRTNPALLEARLLFTGMSANSLTIASHAHMLRP